MTRLLDRALAAGVLALAVGACRNVPDHAIHRVDAASDADGAAVHVPSQGTASSLDVASWNLEWFGDPRYGPTDEPVQLSRVRDVIAGTDFDLWGLEEVVSVAQFQSLLDQLPGYEGLLANDPRVVNGATYYSDFDDQEQKVGVLYKPSIVTVLGAAVVVTGASADFAGRPPLEVKVRISLGGATADGVVIVIHPKCCADADSYQMRVRASAALKAYLDATYPTQSVWVIGDWNDDVDRSIFGGETSPYQNFVDDPARYRIPTQALSTAGVGSTTQFPDIIDHHMISDELAGAYVAGSAQVFRVDAFLRGYEATTSDHYPVLSRYAFPRAAAGDPPAPR